MQIWGTLFRYYHCELWVIFLLPPPLVSILQVEVLCPLVLQYFKEWNWGGGVNWFVRKVSLPINIHGITLWEIIC